MCKNKKKVKIKPKNQNFQIMLQYLNKKLYFCAKF